MNIIRKSYLSTALAATMGILTTCSAPVKQTAQNLSKKITLTELVRDSFNHRASDAQKIIEYNKLLERYKNTAQSLKNYIIVDKKNCDAIVYSPKGISIKKFKVILGRHIGDKRAGGYWNHEPNPRCYTAPGEYDITFIGSSSNKKDKILYKNNLFFLKGDHTEKAAIGKQSTAIHQIPDSRVKADRLNAINSKTLKDNRKSFGCVELTEQDCDSLKKYVSTGSKVYILPEEAGNSLKLEQQNDSTFKFFQTKYRTEN